MESSDSSSEDEERTAMLKEAVGDHHSTSETCRYQYPNNQGEEKKQVNSSLSSLPSLRPDKQKTQSTEEAGLFYADLTKGAKDFVAKKLSQFLEGELDTSEQCFNTKESKTTGNADEDIGIRLFKSSKQLTTSIDHVEEKPIQRRRKISSSDSSSEEERLNEAAVSHDFIVKQSVEVIPSNLTPADIVISQTSDKTKTVNGDGDRKKKKKKKKRKGEEIT